MAVKIWLYVLIVPLITHLVLSLNLNKLFLTNKILEARIFLAVLVFVISYLFVNFINDLITIMNF